MRYRLLALMIIAATLAGCTMGKDITVPDVSNWLERPFAEDEEARFQAAEPVVQWWQQLGDVTLTHLVEQALVHNHEVRIARANLQRARVLAQLQSLDYFPKIETQASAIRQQFSKEGFNRPLGDRTLTTYEAGFDALWEIDVFGRVSQGIEAADARAAASEAGLHDAYVSVAAEIARTYIELRGAQYRLDVATRNAGNQEKTFHLTQTLLENGLGDTLNTARARAQFELTQSTIPLHQSRVHAAINRLGVLTGQAPGALETSLSAHKPLPSVPVTIAVGEPMDLLKRRPDIRRAEHVLNEAIADYHIRAADYYPEVSIIGGLGFLSTTFAHLGTAGSSTYLLGPNIRWAALNLGRVDALVDAADASTQAHIAAFEQAVLRALEEVDTSMVNFTQQEHNRARLLAAAHASARAADHARERFDAGIDNFLDVLDAERTMLNAQDKLAMSETQLALSLIAIYKALGGGWQITQAHDVGEHNE